MMLKENILDVLADMGLYSQGHCTDTYKDTSSLDLLKQTQIESTRIIGKNHEILVCNQKEFMNCFKQTESSLNIKVFTNN